MSQQITSWHKVFPWATDRNSAIEMYNKFLGVMKEASSLPSTQSPILSQLNQIEMRTTY